MGWWNGSSPTIGISKAPQIRLANRSALQLCVQSFQEAMQTRRTTQD